MGGGPCEKLDLTLQPEGQRMKHRLLVYFLASTLASPATAAPIVATKFPEQIVTAHNAWRAQAGVAPLVWDNALGTGADVLGSEHFPAPGVQVWASVSRLLSQGASQLAPAAQQAIVVGLAVVAGGIVMHFGGLVELEYHGPMPTLLTWLHEHPPTDVRIEPLGLGPLYARVHGEVA